MNTRPPILVATLFRELHTHLLELLRTLEPNEWLLPTVCSEWSVKDIVAHLLDGSLRRLSAQRDDYHMSGATNGFDGDRELVAFIHQLNAEWTTVASRFSPQVLIELLEVAGNSTSTMFETSDLFGGATFPVSWAGEEHSLMWFDIAREYTERWHHHRQIALAVGRSTPIDEPHLYRPVLETFMRALPFHFKEIDAPENTFVAIQVEGPAGGRWLIQRRLADWGWTDETNQPTTAELVMPQAIAWQVLTKRWDSRRKLGHFPGIRIHGDHRLAFHALEMVSIMA